jgi:hypothetical protein
MSEADLIVTSIIELYHAVHQNLRDVVASLDDDALNWVPAPQTNSIGTLVTHMLSSEGEMLRSVCGLVVLRDRDEEFARHTYTREALLARIAAAEADLEALSRSLTADDLHAPRHRPNKPAPASGMFWLLRNYGHAREHLAHVELTVQWYRAAPPQLGLCHAASSQRGVLKMTER